MATEHTKQIAVGSKGSQKARPRQVLATARIRFEKQLDLLRAYGASSGPERRAVTNRQAAGLVKMKESTSTHANAFFVDTGLLSRGEGGFLHL